MSEPVQRTCAVIAGVLFGLGLAISQMVNPEKVLAFLDVAAIGAGGWDPSLMFVLGGAVGVNLIAWQMTKNRPQPLFADGFSLPKRTDIDPRLIGGAALFGVGWGLAGYCPGPAIAALPMGWQDALTFTIPMLLAMIAHDWWMQRAPADPGATAQP